MLRGTTNSLILLPNTLPTTYWSASRLTTLSTFPFRVSNARSSSARGASVSLSPPILRMSFPLTVYFDWRPAIPRTVAPCVVTANSILWMAFLCAPRIVARRMYLPSNSSLRGSTSTDCLPGARMVPLASSLGSPSALESSSFWCKTPRQSASAVWGVLGAQNRASCTRAGQKPNIVEERELVWKSAS